MLGGDADHRAQIGDLEQGVADPLDVDGARRTRRVLNLGLVIALAISVSILVLVTQLVTTSAQSVSVVQTSGVTEATSVAGAYAAVTEAKAIEGRVLLGVTPAQAGGAAYSAAVDAAGQALAQLPAAQASGIRPVSSGWRCRRPRRC